VIVVSFVVVSWTTWPKHNIFQIFPIGSRCFFVGPSDFIKLAKLEVVVRRLTVPGKYLFTEPELRLSVTLRGIVSGGHSFHSVTWAPLLWQMLLILADQSKLLQCFCGCSGI